MPLPKPYNYTIEYIYTLPEGQRAELIDGQIYNMAPPNRIHQKLIYQLGKVIGNYIDSKHDNCEVYHAPFAVFLNKDNKNYVEPDISVICDKSKLDDRGCNGAPDWIIEIIKELQADGWYEVNVVGSHHQFKHPTKKGRVTVKHPDKDIPYKTLNSIEKQSGLKFR